MCVSCYRKMQFGFLHSVAIVFMELKEIIIFMVLYSCQICKTNILLFSAMRTRTLGIHQWLGHSLWSVSRTLQHLSPLPQQQQQLLARSWLLLVPRFLFQLPPQPRSLSLGLPVPRPGVHFTQHGMFGLKGLWLNPPQKAPATKCWKSCGKGGKNVNEGGRRGKEPAAAASVELYLSYNDPDVRNPLPAFTPSREPGIHLGVPNLRNTMVSALDFFQLYFTPGLVDEIVQHTNTYAYIEIAKENSKKLCCTESDGGWCDTNPNEILRLIGILIYFGMVPLKGPSDYYWSTATLLHGLWARSFIPRLRFRALMALLHVVDPLNEPDGNKLREVLGFINFLKGRFKALYQPRQHVAIDERMVKSRHRSGIRQYIRDKPTKWGLKYWVLADSSNAYVVDFNIYAGKTEEGLSQHGLGYDVVRKLMQDYEGQGYHLFCDNFYSSLTLARHLYERYHP